MPRINHSTDCVAEMVLLLWFLSPSDPKTKAQHRLGDTLSFHLDLFRRLQQSFLGMP